MRRFVLYRLQYRFLLISLLLFLFLLLTYTSNNAKQTMEAPSKVEVFTYSNYSDKTNDQIALLLKQGLIFINETLEIRPILKPSIFGENLPHLFDFNDVNPNIYLKAPANSFRSPPMLIVGVPTVARETVNYFQRTIDSLMTGLRDYEYYHVLFLVYIAQFPQNQTYTEEIVDWLKLKYPEAVEHGLFEVIEPPNFYYPNFDKITPTFNDSSERMVWRTKQNLDYAYMMISTKLAHANSNFYIQIEDDVLASIGYVTKILNFAGSKPNFFSCEFSRLGFIGKLFHISDLQLLIQSILMFFRDKPVDWILSDLLNSRYCSPESKNCAKDIINVHVFSRTSALFQHVGRHSSLRNKVQLLREKTFKHEPKGGIEEHTINNHKMVNISVVPNLAVNSTVLADFFTYGRPLHFVNPPTGMTLELNFEEPIQMKLIEIRFSFKAKRVSTFPPLVVEYMKAGTYRQLNSKSKYFFLHDGAQQEPMSRLRVSLSSQTNFFYFTYTLLLIR